MFSNSGGCRLNNNLSDAVDIERNYSASIYKFPKIAKLLEEELTSNTFTNWIEPCDFELVDNKVNVIVPNVLYENWISTNYKRLLEYSFNIELGKDIKLTFMVKSKKLESV